MEKVVNNQMVSQSAVTMMLIQMLIWLALPIGLAVWVIKRRSHPQKGATKIFFIGMGIFFLFAGVLEGPFRGIARQFQHTPGLMHFMARFWPVSLKKLAGFWASSLSKSVFPIKLTILRRHSCMA